MVKKQTRSPRGKAGFKARPKTAAREQGAPRDSNRPGAGNSRPTTTVATFASLLYARAGSPTRPVNSVTLQAAPLAHLPYGGELKLKDLTLKEFWEKFRLPGQPGTVIGSPRPRGYRTTSKRRCILRGSYLHLVFGEKLLREQKQAFLESPLEPPEHGRIYSFLQQKLSEPAWKPVAAQLNYLIIRGNYEERVVVFSVRKMAGPLVRKLKILAGHLQKQVETVAGAYVYLDPTGSDYHLESRRPSEPMQLKKLYGPAHLSVRHGGCRFNFQPTSFSPVNESIVGIMLEKAREILAPKANELLIDLYCGYGLFSHYLAAGYKQVIGIDAEGSSIREAQGNAKLNNDGAKTKFHARRISPKAISDLLPLCAEPVTLILDPPRQGPQNGVVEAVSERQPGKILHIFRGVDQIPGILKEWQVNGYQVEKIVPLDMSPGTANLEIMVLMGVKPGQSSPSPSKK